MKINHGRSIYLVTKLTQIHHCLECAYKSVCPVYNVTIYNNTIVLNMCSVCYNIIIILYGYRACIMICVTKRFSSFYVFTIWRFIRCTEAERMKALHILTKSKFKVSLWNVIPKTCHRVESCKSVAWKSIIVRNNCNGYWDTDIWS